MTLFFLAFSINAMYAQKIDLPLERSTFYEVCMDQRPVGFTEAEVATLYASFCPDGTTAQVVKTETLSGTDCGWTSIYTYDVTCGDFVDELKVTYEGGDVSAPELTGDAPGSQSGLNLCFDAIPEGPSIAEIAAIYSDNCGNVNVVKSGTPQGTDCNWSVTYVYAITDDCGNQALNFEITYSGGDTEAPELAKGAVLPEGETGLNLCYSEHPTGPSAEEVAALFVDNCGNVNVDKAEYFKGDDCGWKGEVVYTIYDDCGNQSETLSLYFNGSDQEAPQFVSVPDDVTVSCIDELPENVNLEWTDNCTVGAKGNFSSSVDNLDGLGLACEGGTVIRTWTAVDNCGHTTEVSQTITVLPAPKAEFQTPQDYTINCNDLGNFQPQSLNYGNGVDGGACEISGSVVGVAEDFSGSCGSFVVNYMFTDECGYEITASQTVTVEDTEAPVIEPGKNETVECDGQGNVAEYQAWLANYGDASAIDNCGNVTWTYEETIDPACGGDLRYFVDFIATDDCGNSSLWKGVFHIKDSTPPTVVDAQDMTVECDGNGNMDELNAWLASNGGATASDVCSDFTWSNDFEALSDDCGMTGTVTVTFTATDACDNASETTATFTIQDTTNPEITEAQDMTVECDGNGNMDELNAWLASNGGASASDICSDVTWTNNFDGLSDDCGATGSATVEFTATDDCGNYSKTTATFTIEDTNSPPITMAAQDMTVECDGQGNVSEYQAWLDNNGGATAVDICSDVTWSYQVMGETDDCGLTTTITVLFTVTDDCGLSSSTEADFIIEDTTAPEITAAQDVTVECKAANEDNRSAEISIEQWLDANGGASASDLCGDVTWSNNFDGLSDDCGNTGSATVEFTATDACGNESKTTATYTIVDTTAPTIEVQAADMTVECDGNGNFFQISAWLTSNGGAAAYDICGAVTWSHNYTGLSDECGATGSATVEFTATDECGNTSKTIATFTIEDTTNPEITEAADMTVECDGSGNVEDLNMWLTNNGGATASDICGDVTWSHNFDNLSDDCGATGSAVVEFTATDACGNESKTTATFTIQDTIDPSITDAMDMTVECDGQGNMQQLDAWLANNGGATGSDACSDIVWTHNFTGLSDECGATGSATVEFTATDDCGNYSKTTATFTIEDTTAPGFEVAPQDMTVECDGQGNVDQLNAWLASNGGGYAYDQCGSISWSNNFSGLSDDCGATGSAEVEFTVTDECGNETKATATFTIEDTTNPSIDYHAKTEIVECDGSGNLEDLNAWLASNGGALASDYCGEVSWSNDFTGLSDECGMTGSVTVVFTVADECGNTSKTQADFIIEDTVAPEVTDAQDMTVECDGNGNFAALLGWIGNNGGATASDICGDVTWSNNYEALSDDCGMTGSATVEFTATDACGNASVTTATFTIEDTTAPSIDEEAKPEIVECDGQGNMAELNAWLANNGGATASDICGDVTWSNNFEALSDDCGMTGSATVEFTATDACGNTSKTSATFTIEDTTDPEITDAMDQTVECSASGTDMCTYTLQGFDSFGDGWNGAELDVYVNGVMVATYTFTSYSYNGEVMPIMISNGDTISLEYSDLGGYPGEISYVLNDSDGAEAASGLDAGVEVQAVCPVVLSSDELFAQWLANNGGATASDLCGEVTWSNNSQGLSDDCGATGSETVEFTATDACGNTSKTTATFTIIDTVAPSIDEDAQDMVVECDGNGNMAELQAWLDANAGAAASDLCSDVTWSNDYDSLSDDCGATGSATVTFTATDECGNSSTTSATFTIEDTTDPMIDLDAQDLTVECDGQGNMEDLQMWLDNNGGALASDMCGDVTWSHDFDALSDDCGATGSAVVTFTATDDCGNYATTMATFTIVDTTAPAVEVAKDMIVECDGQGNQAELDAWIASNGGASATDDCSDVTWSYNCGEPTLVNSGSTSGVNEEDVSIPDDNDDGITTIANVSGIPAGATIDNITVDVSIEHTWVGDLGIELIAPSGESLTLLAHPGTENGAGDSSNASAAIEGTISFMDSASTLGEDMGATILGGQTICIDDGICEYIPDTGNVLFADLIAQMITNGADPNGDWSLKVIDRNSGDTGFYSWAINIDWSLYEAPECVLSDECGATGSVTVTFVATDDCGNSTATTATFTVEDTTAPSVEDAKDLTVECDGQGNAADLQAWLDSNGGATATDVCSEFTWTNNFDSLSDDCGMTGSATVEFTVTDECGNASKTTATFTIEDTTAPSIDYEAEDMTVECDGQGNIDELNAWLNSNAGASASDICSEYTWSNNFNGLSDDCGETGSATVEFTVTDDCGNSSKTTATFTIVDTTNPTIDEEAKPEIVECDGNGNMAELQAWLDSNGGAMASDTCSGVTWSNNYGMLSDDCGATGTVTVEFTATDDCGNSAKTTATFTIEDTVAPVLVGVVPQGESNVDVCFDMIPMGPTEVEIGALFYEACGEVVVEKMGKALGDDCSWAVMYTYTVSDECGNPFGDVKVWYNGGDISAPTFNEALPADMTVECDAVPDAAVLTATDNCADVQVEFNEDITLGDCKGEYTIVRTWSVVDNCDNAASHVQTITVVDTTAPVLIGTLPTGENQINACLSGAPEGPTEEEMEALFSDACGDVTVVKETQTWGDDCSWIVNHEYTVYDDCGNMYDGVIKVYYQGSDQNAPEFEVACLDQVIEVDSNCPADATISLSQDDVIDPYMGWTVAGMQMDPIGSCVSDDCTLTKDIVLRVMDVTYGGDDCLTEISVSFEAEDACGNKSDEWLTRTYIIKDEVAPVVNCPDGYDLGLNPSADPASGLPVGLADKAPYTDDCQGEGLTFDYTDDISSVPGQGGNTQLILFSTVTWILDMTLDGVDLNGYNTYSGFINTDPSHYYTYTLTFDLANNRWELKEFAGGSFNVLVFYSLQPTPVPSCDVNDYWSNPNNYTAGTENVECIGGSPTMNYTLVRTFTATDACGNMGECSVTYTWTEENNLPPVPAANPNNSDVGQGTTPDPVDDTRVVASEVSLDFTAFPVPFDKEVTIKYNFEFDTDVTVEVYDTKGLLVLTETNKAYRAGSDASARLDLSGGADQLFYVTVTTSQGSVTKKIVSSTLKRR